MKSRMKKAQKIETKGVGSARLALVASIDSLSDGASRADVVKVASSKIGRLFTQEELDVSLIRYDIGAEVNELRRAEATYGAGLVAEVATAVGRDVDTLYDYASVASLVPRDKFRELTERVNAAGVPLSFSHFVELATKNGKRKDKGLREDQWLALFERALNEKLSVRTLGTLVRRMLNEGTATEAKNGMSLPKLMRMTGRLLDYLSKVDDLTIALESDGSPKNEVQLTTTIEQLEAIRAKCVLTLNRLRAIQGNEGATLAAAE